MESLLLVPNGLKKTCSLMVLNPMLIKKNLMLIRLQTDADKK
jgi:hypothetical protein